MVDGCGALCGTINFRSAYQPSTHPPSTAQAQRFREPFKVKKSPNPAATIPETSSQIVRSVGDPLKVLDTSDANELDALMPRTISNAPAANNVIPRTVFIVILFKTSLKFRLMSNRMSQPC